MLEKFEVGSYYKTYLVIMPGVIYFKVLKKFPKPFTYRIVYNDGKEDTVDCRYSKAHRISKLEGLMKVGQ